MRLRASDLKYLLVIVALVLRLVDETTANVGFFVLALYAFLGLREAIQAIALSWLFSMLSQGIAPDASLAGLGRYAIIFAAGASVFFRYQPRLYQAGQKRIIVYTISLGIVLVVHSLLFSAVPDVSILKVISWTTTATTLFVAWGGLSQKQSSQLIRQLFAGLTAVMLISLPLLMLSLGYLRNGTGFQGIMNQPQSFGVSMALLGVWAAMGLLTLRRPPWKLVLYTGVCLILIIMSESRTAGYALVGGVLSSIIVSTMLAGKRAVILFPGLVSSRAALVIFSSIVISVAFLPQLVGTTDTFILKRSELESIDVFSAFQESRGVLADRMIDNIKERPMTGIGFGIASNPREMIVKRDPIFGIPIGAAIEKGVLPIAVLEEIGVFGLLLFLLWGWNILRAALKSGGAAVALLGTIILLNFGEAMFFSVGGVGMLPLILLGWIATSHKKKLVQRSA